MTMTDKYNHKAHCVGKDRVYILRLTEKKDNGNRIAVDLPELQSMLCCGKSAAIQIAKDSGAGFKIGRRRLYSVDKIKAHLEKLTTQATE